MPVGDLYDATYSVSAAMVTGWLNVAVCQPAVDSAVNVTVASCWPVMLYRPPVCVPVLPADL